MLTNLLTRHQQLGRDIAAKRFDLAHVESWTFIGCGSLDLRASSSGHCLGYFAHWLVVTRREVAVVVNEGYTRQLKRLLLLPQAGS